MNENKTAGAPGSSIRVAVVDDDTRVSRMVARLLKVHDVTEFSNPAEALEAARTGAFDVVVSDIVMPVMDGLKLLHEIRRFDFDLPVILLTGTPSFGTAKQAVEEGAFRYLVKPPDPAEIRSAVDQAAYAYRIAKVRREAAELRGLPRNLPADLAGLSVALDDALESLWMAYQPIVRSGDGSVFGYEALMRSESKALPHPGAILSAAETLAKLNDVGRTVRTRAPAPFAELDPNVALFVNLHPEDLTDETLLDERSPLGVIADRVVLEITERASLDRIPHVMETIRELRAQGYRIAVDDLGSGYAGLASFATLEPELVKVDMSLVRDIDTSTTKQRLVRSVVDLSRDMGRLVVAEGVETAAERNCCAELGVELLQGYFIAKPGKPFPTVTW